MIGIFAWKNDKLLIQKVAGFFFFMSNGQTISHFVPTPSNTHTNLLYCVGTGFTTQQGDDYDYFL